MDKDALIENKLNEYFGEFWPGEHWDFTPDDLRRIAKFFYNVGVEVEARAYREFIEERYNL